MSPETWGEITGVFVLGLVTEGAGLSSAAAYGASEVNASSRLPTVSQLSIPARVIRVMSRGLTNDGITFLDEVGMAPHMTGSLEAGKSQFVNNINTGEVVLQAAFAASGCSILQRRR